MRNYFYISLFLTLFAGGANAADPLLAIKLNNPAAVQYCTAPVLVAESLTIEGAFSITGMKISISEGYQPGEDELVYTGSVGNIAGTWVAAQGYYLLKGDVTTTADNYRDAIKSVKYTNKKLVPTLGIRKISITLEDADYLPATGHFYRFIDKIGFKWTDAEAEAKSDAMMYFGLRGYLATITSQSENDFIKLKTKGVGWIGASDAGVEGDWRWVTGPEGSEDNGKGRLFWKGTGYLAKTNPAVYGPVNNAYFNWNRWNVAYSASLATTNWEPNQSGDEDYAHITVFPTNPNDSYKWNDLPNTGGSGDYASKGYLIEYGGFAGEPVLSLTATLELQVNTMLFKTGTIAPVCEGASVTLNQEDLNAIPAAYTWTPAESLSSPSMANPVATPKITTTYSVTGTRGTCTNTATYTVPVNPKPASLLKAEENICKGQSITLDAGAYPGSVWNTGALTQTITVSVAGDYSVKLTTDKGCTAPPFTSKVVIHDYPTIDLSKLQALICGDTKATIVDITASIMDYSLVSIDGKATVNELNVSVPAFGIYPMVYTAVHPYCPVEKKFDLAFYKTPKVSFSIDENECYGYNLDATYQGDADIDKARFTWVFGGDTIVDGIGRNKEKIPLGVNQSKRDLLLRVEQNGCSDQHTILDIRVTPTLDLSVKNKLRCLPDMFEFLAANTETGVTYDWNFGDGNTGTGTNPTHQYSQSGKYDIQLTVTTDKNCSNTVMIKEMVHAAPVPDVAFSLSADDCLEPGANEISYSGLIGTDNDKYNWDLNNFDLSEIITNPGQTKGPFKFDLKTKPMATLGLKVISEFGCESAPGSIVLKRKPDFTLASNVIAGCAPFEPMLSGIIGDDIDKVDFSWDFGDETTETGSQVSHTYYQPDKSYNIILSGKSSITGCSNEVINNNFLKTFPKPKAAFGMDNKIVYNDAPTVNFSNQSTGGKGYSWNFGDGTTSDLKNPSHNYKLTGYRTVLMEVSNEFLCTDTVSHQLLIAFDRIFPPNGFSPNAPNAVDREFKLGSDGIAAEGYHLTIVSRWNDIIFEAKDEMIGWDGHMKNGSLAPSGLYLWVLNFTDFLGRKHRQTGTVTLVY